MCHSVKVMVSTILVIRDKTIQRAFVNKGTEYIKYLFGAIKVINIMSILKTVTLSVLHCISESHSVYDKLLYLNIYIYR